MPYFTIESSYRLPVFRHRTYEAATVEDACRLAIEDDDWQRQKDDYESAGATYLTGIWPGSDTAYQVAALPVPLGFAEGAAAAAATPDRPVDTPKPSPVMPRCRHCGSDRISRDANACWDEETQAWELLATYDSQTCERCGADSNNLVLWVPVAEPESATAFLWAVVEALEEMSLAWDADFQGFCTERHGQLTADEAASQWRNAADA